MCLTRYRTRHFFNNSNINEDIATKFEQEYVRCVRNEEEWRNTSFREDWCLVWDVPAARCLVWDVPAARCLVWDVPVARDWSHLLRCKRHNTLVNQLDISSRTERHPTLHMPTWPKFIPFSVTASFRRDFGHRARPIWRRLTISYGDVWKGEFTETNHEPQTPWNQTSPKKFRQWQRTYWQGLSKIWRAGFDPVWTQMVATSSTCYDVVTFLTQWSKSVSNFVAISSLVVKLLKKCRVR